MAIRLNKYLASCGLASRRKVDEFVLSGRVALNGRVVRDLSTTVEETDTVTLDGKEVSPESRVYIVMNKPQGDVCAVEDRFDMTVIDVLPPAYSKFRLFPVGRLDKESEGLLVLTNDGDFAHFLMHPSSNIKRDYEVLLNEELTVEKMKLWLKGFEIEGGFVRPLSVQPLCRPPYGRWVTVSITEGQKREVRLMAEHLGYKVMVLIRRRIGRMELRNLNKGQTIKLSQDELLKKIERGGIV